MIENGEEEWYKRGGIISFFCESVTHEETDQHTNQWTEKPFYRDGRTYWF